MDTDHLSPDQEDELVPVDDDLPRRSRSFKCRESTRIKKTRNILRTVEAISQMREENIQRRDDYYSSQGKEKGGEKKEKDKNKEKGGAKEYLLTLVGCVRRPPPRSPTSRWSSRSVDDKLDKIREDAEFILSVYEEKAARDSPKNHTRSHHDATQRMSQASVDSSLRSYPNDRVRFRNFSMRMNHSNNALSQAAIAAIIQVAQQHPNVLLGRAEGPVAEKEVLSYEIAYCERF
ncbi:hypothetical protein PENTCL1PPCAC_12343, partial [Pristionchus entomophagus]